MRITNLEKGHEYSNDHEQILKLSALHLNLIHEFGFGIL